MNTSLSAPASYYKGGASGSSESGLLFLCLVYFWVSPLKTANQTTWVFWTIPQFISFLIHPPLYIKHFLWGALQTVREVRFLSLCPGNGWWGVGSGEDIH